MAYITLNRNKLRDNYTFLNNIFKPQDISWAVVAKVLCGNKLYLNELIKMGAKQICDSRISHLEEVKKLNPEVETIFIKPAAKRNAARVVAFADISFNTEYDTIRLLSEEAGKQGKVHRIVIMMELGELREGVMRDQFVEFYSRVFKLPNIKVIGIGTNLTCMYGVLPNHDKLIQLSLYKQLIEAKFNQKIPYLSGGASVTIPLIEQGLLPPDINHFRVGETLFLGTDVYHNERVSDMHQDVFKLYAEVIELNEKPAIPMGELGQNLTGHTLNFDQSSPARSSVRAIVDIGLLDVEEGHIKPADPDMHIVGASSDMIVVDLGENERNLKVGSVIEFKMDYMGLLRIMSSAYVDKRFEFDPVAGYAATSAHKRVQLN
jgi:predicted amino acid racemase